MDEEPDALKTLRQELTRLRQERDLLLKNAGYPVDYMEIQYHNYSNTASAELARIEGTETTYFEYRIIEDRIYLPLRKICEYFGEEVYWDNEEHKAYIVRGEEKIDMTGTIIEDRTFIKMRDFEKLGYTLDWKDMGNNSYIVEIYKDINK